MRKDVLLLGIDGGGTSCRARLTDREGRILGEGLAGPANIRYGLDASFSAVREAASQCLSKAGLPNAAPRTIACLALAGAVETSNLAAVRSYPHPFHWAIITSDARAACIGAHAGRDGGIVIIGTGSIGWAIVGGEEHRVGGWGFPISDDGSGAWLGLEALRRSLWARDGLIPSTGLSQAVLRQFEGDPYMVVREMHAAGPRKFASLVPLVVEHAGKSDRLANELLELAAKHIDAIAARLIALGVSRLSLMGGLAGRLEPLVSDQTRNSLVPPAGDALSGALQLAREEANRLSEQV